LTYEVNDVTAGAEIVAGGMAYMLLPRHLSTQFGDLVRIPLEDDVHWKIGAIVSDRRCSPAAALLLDLLS